MPFVPTPAAFFSAVGGVVIRRTFSAGAGQRGLESAAQFSTGCIVIGGTVCRAASFYTGCYPAHNSGEPALESPAQFTAGGVVIGSTISVRCAARGKKFRLLSDAQFRLFSAGGRLLSTAQFARCGKLIIVIGSTIRILGGFPKVSKPGVIGAHFRQRGCYRAHSFQTVEFGGCCYRRHISEKSTVQRAAGIVIHGTIRFFRGGTVVIRRTIRKNPVFCGAPCRGLLACAQFAQQGPGLLSTAQFKDFSARVVIQRTIPRARIFHPPCWNAAHISHFSFFSRPGLLYSTLFKNPTKFSLPPFLCKKTFLPLLRSAHCCVLHIRVGMPRTAPL